MQLISPDKLLLPLLLHLHFVAHYAHVAVRLSVLRVSDAECRSIEVGKIIFDQ